MTTYQRSLAAQTIAYLAACFACAVSAPVWAGLPLYLMLTAAYWLCPVAGVEE